MASKADLFMSDVQDSNFGVRPKGHTPSFGTRPEETAARDVGVKRSMHARVIKIDRIIAKEQVRKHFDETELAELAHSLKTLGQQTPILVYWNEENERYVIIAGERRFRAAKIAGLTQLACQIHPQKPDEAELVELQFVENAIRTDLNPIEEALSYKKLQDLKGFSANQLSERIGKNQTTISRSLRLLQLPATIQEQIGKGEIPISVAREIMKLDSETAQVEMAQRYLDGELTTAQAQKQAAKKNSGRGQQSAKQNKKWTQQGISVTVAYGRGITLNDIADVLEARAKLLRSDGRGKNAA